MSTTQLALFDGPPTPTQPEPTSRQTRRASWHAVRDDGRLGQRQQQVLDAITAHGPISDRGLAVCLNWPINRLVPRRNELAASGHIQQAGTVIDDETNRRVAAWVAA